VKAVEWYLKAAAQNDSLAQFNLGRMYRSGYGVSKDDFQASKWYRLAAGQGLALAQYNLGVQCLEGRGIPQNFEEAIQWFLLAAKQGLWDAQYNLALMYKTGKGTTRNCSEAYKWFYIVALNGDEEASQKRDSLAAELTPSEIADAEARAKESVNESDLVRKLAAREDKPTFSYRFIV
jgi:TPR repeat protein